VPESSVGEPNGKQAVPNNYWVKKEQEYEKKKSIKGTPASGYLLGRHQECDRIIHSPTVSNRHCLIWSENRAGDSFAIVEDLSGNGTYVNNTITAQTRARQIEDQISRFARLCFSKMGERFRGAKSALRVHQRRYSGLVGEGKLVEGPCGEAQHAGCPRTEAIEADRHGWIDA
jgi:hypothetical protein